MSWLPRRWSLRQPLCEQGIHKQLMSVGVPFDQVVVDENPDRLPDGPDGKLTLAQEVRCVWLVRRRLCQCLQQLLLGQGQAGQDDLEPRRQLTQENGIDLVHDIICAELVREVPCRRGKP